jgi:hypothetical protein
MTLRVAVVLALVSFVADPKLSAQTTQSQERDHATPGWVFTPSLGVGGAWDNNILLVNPASNPPRDYATPIDPSLSLDYHGRRAQFSTAYEGSFLMYRSLSELNSSEQRARGFFQYHATRHLSIFAQEGYSSAPTTDSLEVAGVPFYRVGSHSNVFGGGAQAALARHTVLRGEYRLQTLAFDKDDPLGRTLQGGHAHQWTATLTQALSDRFTIGGLYELERAITSNSSAIPASLPDVTTVAGVPEIVPFRNSLGRFDVNTVGATADYQLSGTLVLSGMVGVSRLNGDTSVAGITAVERTGPALRAAIARRTPRLTLAASYERSFIPSYGFGGTYQNEAYQANAHVPFSRGRGYADGSIVWFNNQPIDPLQPELASWFVSSTLGYHLTRWLSMEGFVDHTQQDSHRPGGQLARTQVGFRMVTAKPIRLR